MFDLVTGKAVHTPHHQAAPLLVSVVAHVTILASVIGASYYFVREQLPRIPTMLAFVTPMPPPPAPPAPPAPAPDAAAPQVIEPVPTAGTAAPIEAPAEIVAAPLRQIAGMIGGVPGGVPGGVVGGIPGGGLDVLPPPPPPEPRAPIRIGGEVKEPELLHRVPPVYPPLAVAANVEGTVILEAMVDEEGRVLDVQILRSVGLLDQAAIEAVRQWRYSPVLLNGRPERFILTVVVTFRLERA